MSKLLVVNADDFGASPGINRGIVEAHTRGIVTSTSAMVTGPAIDEAAALGAECPGLSIGLHWDVTGEGEREFDLEDAKAVGDELDRQLARFHELFGRRPTHLDSHQHAHRAPKAMPVFEELARSLGVPLRHDGQVRYVGHFYAQWKWGVTELEHVGVPYLEQLLREEIRDGWNELSCHPGYITPGFRSIYMSEREVELETLTDPRAREALDHAGIRLVGYAEWTP